MVFLVCYLCHWARRPPPARLVGVSIVGSVVDAERRFMWRLENVLIGNLAPDDRVKHVPLYFVPFGIRQYPETLLVWAGDRDFLPIEKREGGAIHGLGFSVRLKSLPIRPAFLSLVESIYPNIQGGRRPEIMDHIGISQWILRVSEAKYWGSKVSIHPRTLGAREIIGVDLIRVSRGVPLARVSDNSVHAYKKYREFENDPPRRCLIGFAVMSFGIGLWGWHNFRNNLSVGGYFAFCTGFRGWAVVASLLLGVGVPSL